MEFQTVTLITKIQAAGSSDDVQAEDFHGDVPASRSSDEGFLDLNYSEDQDIWCLNGPPPCPNNSDPAARSPD